MRGRGLRHTAQQLPGSFGGDAGRECSLGGTEDRIDHSEPESHPPGDKRGKIGGDEDELLLKVFSRARDFKLARRPWSSKISCKRMYMCLWSIFLNVFLIF